MTSTSHADAPAESAWPLTAGRFTVGADEANEIRIAARGVSRFHAVIENRSGGCVVEDLGSKNGSQVNGRAITEQRLEDGDLLTFGTARLVVEQRAHADVALALELEDDAWGSSAAAATSRLGRTVSRLGARGDGVPYALLAALVTRLRQRPVPDLDGFLVELVARLGAGGAALVDAALLDAESGDATLVASAGRIGSLTLPARGPWKPLDGTADIGTFALDGGGLVAFRLDAGRGVPATDADVLVIWPSPTPSTVAHSTAAHSTAAHSTAAPSTRASVASARDWTPDVQVVATALLLLDGLGEVPAEVVATDSAPASPAAGRAGLRLAEGIVGGTTGPMAGVYAQVALVASDAMPVLIRGETGVGKEHIAHALHDASTRRDGPFVAINCAAIPAELLEAELFGIGRGVATGVSSRRGRFRDADGGSIFLDEVGDLPPALQVKLLRVLEDGEVAPVGEPMVKVDVRLIAATHTDLQAAIAARRFREDLYFRLAGYVLRVPSLRERPDDLPILVGHFLRESARSTGRRVRGVTIQALETLATESWPGNIRQLQHVARRLIYLCPPGQSIDSSMVREALDVGAPATPLERFVLGAIPLDEHLGAVEKRAIEDALKDAEGNRSQAARRLGISRNSLARRIRRLGATWDG